MYIYDDPRALAGVANAPAHERQSHGVYAADKMCVASGASPKLDREWRIRQNIIGGLDGGSRLVRQRLFGIKLCAWQIPRAGGSEVPRRGGDPGPVATHRCVRGHA